MKTYYALQNELEYGTQSYYHKEKELPDLLDWLANNRNKVLEDFESTTFTVDEIRISDDDNVEITYIGEFTRDTLDKHTYEECIQELRDELAEY